MPKAVTRNSVSGSTSKFSSVTDTRIFELLPGGTSQTEITSFFEKYDDIKESISSGKTITDLIYNQVITAPLSSTAEIIKSSDVNRIVNSINNISIEDETHQYLIFESNQLVNSQYPIYTQLDFNNLTNTLNDISYLNESFEQNISGSLIVISQFDSAMKTITDNMENFNLIVSLISKDPANNGLVAQLSAASLRKSLELGKVFFDTAALMSTTFLNKVGYDYTSIFSNSDDVSVNDLVDTYIFVSKIDAIQIDKQIFTTTQGDSVLIQMYIDSSNPNDLLFDEIIISNTTDSLILTRKLNISIFPGNHILNFGDYIIPIVGVADRDRPRLYFTFEIPFSNIDEFENKSYDISFKISNEIKSKDISQQMKDSFTNMKSFQLGRGGNIT